MYTPDQRLINAVINQESAGNPMAVSPKGAAGIMQIMPDTARNPGYGVRPLQGWDGVDPRTAPVEEQIRFGTDYLQAMMREHGGDPRLALAAYNAGPGAVQQHGGVPPYRETQNYVSNIMNNAGVQVASNEQNSWRNRAQVVMSDAAPAINYTAPTNTVQPSSDWRSRAQSEQPQPAAATGDWKSRAQAVDAGTDMGAGAAAVQGFNSAIPFGERIAAGLGATGAYLYDKATGLSDTSLGEYYDEARRNQHTTAQNHSGAYAGGAVAGIAATLPMASTKVLTGTRATTGVRGAVNAVPEMLQGVGNFVRGSGVAANAGTAAKAVDLTGKAVRSALVAAPAGAVYSYGASENDLNSAAALADAKQGAKLAAGVGAAVPVVGAALNKAVKPVLSDATKVLAQRAKDFGIDLSLDQVSPGRVRSTIQKISQNIPGSGVDAFQDAQRAQWNRALAGTLGENADNLAPEVIQNYLTRAGQEFEGALKGTTIKFTQKDLAAIADIAANSKRKISAGLADVVQNNVDDFIKNLDDFKVGEMRQLPGEKLASLRSQILQDLPSIDGGARQQVAKIIDKLDEVVDRHLSPEQIKNLQNARLQWRNYRTIQPLLEKSTDGQVNPTQLMQRVASSKFIKASSKKTGEDSLVDLARIGKQFLPVKEGSDTAQKILYMKAGAGGLAGGAAFANLPATLAGIGANAGYQRFINQSPSVVSRAVTGAPVNAAAVPIADMLAAGATQRVTGK